MPDPGARGYTAELPEQGEPEVGTELIRVRHDDGRTEELRLHEYARVYSVPGLYERIVHEQLGCGSPDQIASMLATQVDRAGWDRDAVRVIDLAAGNGISGEALRAHGLRPVLGTDIVPAAREAALRDRPGVYDAYLTLDLLTLSESDRAALRVLDANALACVAPVGTGSGQLPPGALASAVRLLAADALVAYMHDPNFGIDDEVTARLWADSLGPGVSARELERRRYLHRRTVGGRPYEMDAVVWRIRRGERV